MDEVFVVLHSKCKGAAVKPSHVIATHRSITSLLIPLADIDRLLSVQGSWEGSEIPLARVVQSPRLGALLFGSACTSVIGAALDRIVGIGAESMFEIDRPVSLGDIVLLKRECMRQWHESHGALAISEKRVVTVVYRGVQLPLKVTSLLDEADIRCWAAIKTAAVNAGLLTPLFLENDLVSDRAAPAFLFSSSRKSCRVARLLGTWRTTS